MANTKITELTALTQCAATDVLPIVKVSANTTKKVSISDLLRNAPAGTAGAPGIANADDQDTGILFPAANSIGVSTGGTQRLVIDSSGNVGIGTTPSTSLDVSGAISLGSVAIPSAGTARIYSRNTDNNLYLQTGSGDTINFLDGSQNTLASFGDTALVFNTGNTERLRIDSSGRLLLGTTTEGSSSADDLTVATSAETGITIRSGTSSNGNIFFSDGTSGDSEYRGFITYAHNGDSLRFATTNTERMRIGSSGNVVFQNSNYVSFNKNGYIRTDSPGYLRLQAGSNGTMFTNFSNSEVARINSSGYFKARNTNGSYISATSASHEFNQSGNTETLAVRATNSSYSSQVCTLYAVRAATSSYWFFRGVSSSGSASADNEFYIKGDGNAYIDGSWNGGGADYAEYFEWSDGNTEAEDRRGISVVLDGDKIREAVDGEEPIGVISGNPSVVGDNDVDRWKNKYLRDDYGSYVLDEDGYRQLNPDYDSSVEYVQREDRPEWDTVGLMGKLRIRKGQITGSRWIKMRDVSSSVEEWLVR